MSETTSNAPSTENLERQIMEAKIAALNGEALEAELKLEELLATWQFARQLNLVGKLDPQMAATAIQAMAFWRRLDKDSATKTPIHLGLNLFDGSFIQTMAVYDYVRWMRQAGHKVTMQVTGRTTIHGAILMQAADERVITPSSWIELQEQDFRAGRGNTADMGDLLKFFQEVETHGRQLLADRSRITMEQIKEHTAYKRTWHIDAEEALKLGVVDRVGVVIPAPARSGLPVVESLPTDSLDVRLKKAQLRKELAEAGLGRMNEEQVAAQSVKNNSFLFFGEVEPGLCLLAQTAMQQFANQPGDIDLFINSPGGSVVDGAALINVINEIKAQTGKKVTTYILGYAASMGGFLSQVGDHRVMGENARFLIHRASTMFEGGNSEMQDEQEYMQRLEAQLLPVMAAPRSALTVQDLKDRSEHKDWWLNAAESKQLKLVDEVR